MRTRLLPTMTIQSIIFDLDGTLTTVPSPWRHVHERLGVWEDTASSFLNQWLAGEIPYEEFCRRDFELWAGHDVQEIEGLLDEIEINSHVPDIVRRLREEKIPSFIISSGFSYIAHKIRDEHQWEPLEIYANDLADGPEVRIRVSADFDSPISKRRLADKIFESTGVDPDRTLVVSDSERDLEMLSQCGHQLLVEAERDLSKVHEFIGRGRP